MSTYVKSAFWDWLLCVIASSALAYSACSGFYATQPFQQGLAGVLAIVGICAVASAALFATSFNTRTMMAGIPMLVIAAVAAFAASFATSAGSSVFDDVAGNNVFFALCTVIPPIAVFLLSRRRWTTALLLVLGVLVCSAIEYLYWYGHAIPFVAFLVSCAALFMYRTYQRSLLASETDRLAFTPVTLAGIALAGLAVLASLGIYAAAIAPFDPPHLVVKLITEHFRIEEVEVRGIASVSDTTNPSLLSTIMGAVTVASSQASDMLEDQQSDDQTDRGENEQDSLGLAEEGAQDTSVGSGLGTLGLFDRPWLIALLALGLLVLIAIAILVKKRIRARRYRAMVARGPDEAVVALYLFFLERFKKLKMPQPESRTLAEYVRSASGELGMFEQGAAGPSFAEVTDVYVRRQFGDERVSDGEFALYESFYRVFYKRARSFVGRWKYCAKFFFI